MGTVYAVLRLRVKAAATSQGCGREYPEGYDLGLLGATLRVVCRCDGVAGEGGDCRHRLEPCDGDPDERDPGFYVGDCAGSEQASWAGGYQPTQLGISCALRSVYGALVALLLPRTADGAGFQRGSGG